MRFIQQTDYVEITVFCLLFNDGCSLKHHHIASPDCPKHVFVLFGYCWDRFQHKAYCWGFLAETSVFSCEETLQAPESTKEETDPNTEKTEPLGSTRVLATPVRSSLKDSTMDAMENQMEEAQEPKDMEKQGLEEMEVEEERQEIEMAQQLEDSKGPTQTEVTGKETEGEQQEIEMAQQPEDSKGPTETEVTGIETEGEKQETEFAQQPEDSKGPTETEVTCVETEGEKQEKEVAEELEMDEDSDNLIVIEPEDDEQSKTTAVQDEKIHDKNKVQTTTSTGSSGRRVFQSALKRNAIKAKRLTMNDKTKIDDKKAAASRGEAGGSGETSEGKALKSEVRTACKAKAKAKSRAGSAGGEPSTALEPKAKAKGKAKAKAKSSARSAGGEPSTALKPKAKAKGKAKAKAKSSARSAGGEPSTALEPKAKAKGKAKAKAALKGKAKAKAKRSAEDMEKNESPDATEETQEQKMDEIGIKKKLHSVFWLMHLVSFCFVLFHFLHGGSILGLLDSLEESAGRRQAGQGAHEGCTGSTSTATWVKGKQNIKKNEHLEIELESILSTNPFI